MSDFNTQRRNGRLPEFPSEHYAAYGLFDFRSSPRTQAAVWGSLTDGPATHDDAFDAVAEHVEKNLGALCHPWLGVAVLRTQGSVTEDVTLQMLEAINPAYLSENA